MNADEIKHLFDTLVLFWIKFVLFLSVFVRSTNLTKMLSVKCKLYALKQFKHWFYDFMLIYFIIVNAQYIIMLQKKEAKENDTNKIGMETAIVK